MYCFPKVLLFLCVLLVLPANIKKNYFSHRDSRDVLCSGLAFLKRVVLLKRNICVGRMPEI